MSASKLTGGRVDCDGRAEVLTMTVGLRGHNQSTEHQLNVHIVQGEI
jgi:hypothetical protein